MEPSDLPPLPPSKKRKHKLGGRGTMHRSRSFVAEMFHIDEASPSIHKQWSSNDMHLLEKLGISPNNKERNQNRHRLKISPNLHPDLKQHAYEEQINSLSTELQQTKINLKRAAEYGQHLIEENSKMEAAVVELKNEAAEYIAQILELGEENERCKIVAQSNEFSVNEYQDKVHQITNDTRDLNDAVFNLRNELNDMRLKLEMEQSKSKLYQNENKEIRQNVEEKHNEIEDLKTKLLIIQNTNHSLVMERNEFKKHNEKILHQHSLLETEYDNLCKQYMEEKREESPSREDSRSHSQRDRLVISRRNSHSRSRSTKREDLEEKMDEVMDIKKININESDNEYKSDPIAIHNDQKYEHNDAMMECMHLFEDILDDQHIHSPIKPARNTSIEATNIDVELFRELMQSVRNKLAEEKYGGQLCKRDISLLRRNSKSNSHVLETLDSYMVDTNDGDDDDHDHELTLLKVPTMNDDEEDDEDDESGNQPNLNGSYEADNEDLDNLPNKEMMIEPIDDRQKKCVEQFLMRYSENNSWHDTDTKYTERDANHSEKYELEIEFNENINLENKKRNNISLSAKVLQSLTNLIENIMDIRYRNEEETSYFSMCGWFCGRTSTIHDEYEENYSQHYLNILSSLDYKKENREEIYWVIYQLLSVIYKYYNHTNCTQSMSIIDIPQKNVDGIETMRTPTREHSQHTRDDDGNVSSSESMSMVFTSTKSKYAELKPPARKRLIKNKLNSYRASFTALASSSSEDDERK